MGNFFTSTQIYNEKLNREEFIENFCRKMAEEGYVTCDSDESELSYILRFADNCKWVTITSEAYEQGNEVSKKDTGRIAKMLGAPCVNTVVIDSDCAILELYDKNGKKADMFTIGRADDYFGDGNPQPSEKVWKPFISKESSWEQFTQVCGSDEVFVEDGLLKFAPIIGMNSYNITFSAEDADEIDTSCAFLDFKSARSFITMSRDGKTVETQPQKFTINAAFKQIFGEALEPYGFKTIKGRYPYLVRLINNEILHVITFYPENPYYPYDKAFAVVGGVATIYRKRLSFDISPKQNHDWLNYIHKFFSLSPQNVDIKHTQNIHIFYYSSDSPESMISALKASSESVTKYVLPEFDKTTDIDSCLDYFEKLMGPCNPLRCENICSYYPDDDEAFLYFLSEKRISNRPDFLENYLNDSEFHNWVLTEIKKRKTENIAILKESGLFEQPESEKAEQRKLTLKSAFTKVFGETLEPLGFVKLKKTKEPCYVRIVGDGIINVITYRTLSAYKTGYKNVEILLGILSLYNPELIFLDDPTCSLYCIQGLYNSDYYRELGIKPRNETIDNVIDFECKLWDINKNLFSDPEVRKSEFDKRIGHCLCSTSDSGILLRAFNNTCDVIKDVVLPIMEKIKDNKEYIEYCYSLRRDVKLSTDINDFRENTRKDGNGLLLIKENYTADTSKYTERDLAMYVDAIEHGRRGLGDAANIEDFKKKFRDNRKQQKGICETILNTPKLKQVFSEELERYKEKNINVLIAYGFKPVQN